MAIASTTATYCTDIQTLLGDELCANADRYEWSQVAGPASSVIDLGGADGQYTLAVFPNPGLYTVRRCCFTNINDDVELPPDDDNTEPLLVCPTGAIVGDIIPITLTGCEDGVVNWTTSLSSTTIIGLSNTSAVLTINDDDVPIMTVIATCTVDGVSTEYRCVINLYPADQEFEETVIPAIQIEAVECGESCTCETVDVIVQDCSDAVKTPLKTLVSFKKELPSVEKVEKKELTRVQLVGQPLAAYEHQNVISKPCEDDIGKDVHVPAILWNDAYNCGWTVEASNAVNGTHIFNALGYNLGMKYCFMGTTTLNFSGPSLFIDTLVLYGHNMTDATVTTSPLTPFGGGSTSIGVVSDKSCLEGYTNPGIVYFSDVQDNITSLQVTITPSDPTKVCCIEHIFLGAKFLDIKLPDDWRNPFLGNDRELIIKRGACGPVSAISKRKEISLSIPIRCLSEDVYKECYLPMLRYLSCNPLLFAYSLNRCPTELFYGFMESANEGATYDQGLYPNNSIEATGFIRQKQPKDFV